MAKIRSEINLLDHNIEAAAADTTSNEIAQLDSTQYNGTVTYYFEVLCSKTAGDVGTIALRRSGTSTDDATIASADIPTTLGLVRSAAFTPPASATSYRVFVDYTSGTGIRVKSARIVIIQEADTLTNTETQIEIGNYNLVRTTESAAILTNPKYWKYDASKWDGTKTFYAEAVYDSGSMDTVTVQLREATDIAAPTWNLHTTIVSAAETTVPTRTRVAFTPVDGRWYTIFSLNGSMDNHDIYRAGVVVQQKNEGSNVSHDSAEGIAGGTSGAGQLRQATGQAFVYASNQTVSGVKLRLYKTGSPTDTLNIDIVSSLTGSSLANATQSCSALTTTETEYEFTFDAPVALTGSTTYYIRLTRSPDTYDNTNKPIVSKVVTGSTYSGGSVWHRDNNSWSEAAAQDFYFYLISDVPDITKLEPQYLLANTLLAAGTSLQTFLTKWDSTEWDGVTNAYYFQGEAANNSTSDMTLQQADGGGAVTNSTLTNIDNAQISAAMTMPSSEDLDVIANANAGDVAAARILVTTVIAADTTLDISVSDTTNVTELVTAFKTTQTVAVSDTTAITELVTARMFSNINVSDTSNVTELVTMAGVLYINVSDTSAITEAVTARLFSNINVSDTTAVTDTPTIFIPILTLSVNDTTAITELVNAQLVSYVNVSDETVITDTPTITIITTDPDPNLVSVSDTSNVTDTPTLNLRSYINVSDTSAVTELVTTAGTLYISVSDTSAVTESVTVMMTSYINVSDTSTITELVTLSQTNTINVSVSDTSAITENVALSLQSNLSVSDTTAVTEVVIMAGTLYVSVSDTTTVTEAVSINLRSYINVSDTISITELVVMSGTEYITVSDTSAITELVTMAGTEYVNVSDTSAITENVLMAGVLYINVSDTTPVTESTTLNLVAPGSISVIDQTTVTEGVEIVIANLLISVSDTTGVTDEVTLTITEEESTRRRGGVLTQKKWRIWKHINGKWTEVVVRNGKLRKFINGEWQEMG